MGLFDRVGRIFETDKERKRRIAKERRQAFRQADNAIGTIVTRINSLRARRQQQWEEARTYLKNGQKGAARRSLQGVRATELIIDQLEKKRFVFEQIVIRFEVAGTDEEFATALGSLNTVIEIDIDSVEDVLDIAQEKLGDQLDVDRVWEQVYQRDMGDVMTQPSDVVLSVDDMLASLEQETGMKVTEPKAVEETPAAPAETSTVDDTDVNRRAGEGRRRIKELMEGEDQ